MSGTTTTAASVHDAESSPATKQKKKNASTPVHYPFWFGGSASGMAACVTHPLDLVKVRLQTRTGDAPKNMSGTFVSIFRKDGPLGLYSGLSAALLRQLTYSTVRFGIYEEMKSRFTAGPDGEQIKPSFPLLVAMASSSGLVGGVAGNFADVLNVRMQHDAALPVEKRRNYRHAVDGMVRMAREEGLASWFRGWLPNSGRAAVMTASQLASYDAFKRLLLDYTPLGDDLTTHFSASFLAGLVAATVTSPIDVIKTRVMSSSHNLGILRLIGDIYRTDGPGWVFKGWVPSFLRLGPHTICTFVFLEMHRKTYRNLKGLEEPTL
ncbi:solute carrier family 25 (mitochondrial dicarboxylate transporter), member 10 [Geosmithia morbida]|uniref:Solute carrier family 25 (Mitochondrial dicarboxylate transporter), member 10 n=1 Tax=Geosmithia morbida TaxID=1094350 RepID=A0A9P4YXN4_9HYPO|nr:solute carrier family 25 (mitochondrial dicarboxylate transporter), member 10 [Geosmithia morbida]KAF4123697.1 solute carrier family 25 (mitochondrial dicarboxylate transporter), member 10 [Geosmithia morbida]